MGLGFSSPIILDRSEPCRCRFLIFEKKVRFLPLKGKKLTRSHIVENKLRSSNMAKSSLKSCRCSPGDGFQYLSSYQNVSRSQNRKQWKKSFQIFFLTNFLEGYFRALLEKPFFSKKYYFSFYRNFGFKLKMSSNLYCYMKRYIKVELGRRS